ncbi:low temperature requirement protein A [Diaphorobacter sp. HDW4A]|uniref:low temperature requirement protein A n=1 Tax=Diaphorobacter sp. HDW4A TaxID=2714924 RepID=UPI001408470B|nr:low temperature requirement protein A [Diaphorobacter sp. HDW4A]QIL79203.1 low temperature requirement protein A [Diaphorobacter sp. HDW4A]
MNHNNGNPDLHAASSSLSSSNGPRALSLLRHRDGHHAKVTYEELFFDLVYVFAVTQLSHALLHHLSFAGLVETLILWFGVWLGWQYTCWFTNWFNPEAPAIRGVVFVSMLLALFMACAIPEAYGAKGVIFACSYVAMQVGRTAYVVWLLGPSHPMAPNYRRMLGWLSIAGVFWIAGAFAEHEWRIALWLVAIACEYFSPMIGFALPGLGRSSTSEWTIEGAHLVERCQLFVIVALGETLIATGAVLSKEEHWGLGLLLALGATFFGTLAMWWLYFGTSSKDANTVITTSDDPGRIGAYFHYIHVVLVAGIIGSAVGNDLVMAHPYSMLSTAQVFTLVGGPAVYLLGSAFYKQVVYGCVPMSHIAGAIALLALVPVGFYANLLVMGWLTTAVLLVVSFRELQVQRKPRVGNAVPHHG